MVDFTQRIAAASTVALEDHLSELLDTAIAAASRAEYEATRGSGAGDVSLKRIGAGYIGVECDRELGFRYHKFLKEGRPSSVTPGELQRHAESGHWTEAMTAKWLRLIGFDLATDTGKINTFGKPEQIGWKAARDPETGQYRMAGEVDGVIHGFRPTAFATPEQLAPIISILKPPCIWESKKATDKKWKKFVKEGVKGADPKYYGQLQSNMAYLEAGMTLFTMLNLDNMKFHFEVVLFDQAKAQKLSDRAVNTMQTKSPFELSRLCRAEDDFSGRYCDFYGQCWKGLVIEKPERVADVEKLKQESAILNAADRQAPVKRPIFNPNFKV